MVVTVKAKQKVIRGYRYISWFFTSVLYMTINSPENTIKYKIAVVVSLLIITIMLNDLYLKSNSIKAIKRVNIGETLVIAVLLIPTGGLDSPFLWYALNPVLVAATFSKTLFSFLDLCFYLVISSIISLKMFNSEGLSFIDLIKDKTNIILAFILIIVAVYLLSTLIQYLDNQAETLKSQKEVLLRMNEELEQANASAEHSMEHIMSIYHIIEAYSVREDTGNILKRMIRLTDEIMECKSFIWLAAFKEHSESWITENLGRETKDILEEYLISQFDAISKTTASQMINQEGDKYLLVPLRSSFRFYGCLGIQLRNERADNSELLNLNLLSFLANLMTMVLERTHFENVSSQLMLFEEQNRIANEIHDNVSQRLFSLICGIHALNVNWGNLDIESIDQQLSLLEQSAKNVSAELRTSIYRLSTKKRGERALKNKLKSYLDDFANFHQIKIEFDVQGDEERLTYELKKAIFRIIQEGSGNAVRHGKCTHMELRILIQMSQCELTLIDNGQGFDVESVLADKNNTGLGLNNMQTLAQAFMGSFDLTSEVSEGTMLKIRFPLANISKRGGVA